MSTSTKTIEIVAAPRQPLVTSQSDAIRALTFVVAAISPPSCSLSMQQLHAQFLLDVSCSSSSGMPDVDLLSSPLQLKIGSDSNYSALQGTIGGNTILLSAFTLIAFMLPYAPKLMLEPEDLRFPGIIYAPYSFLIVPTTWAASSGVPTGYVVLAAIVWLLPLVAIVLVVTAFFSATTRNVPVNQGTFLGKLYEWFLPGFCWVDRPKAQQRKGFVERWGSLFEPFRSRRQWFCVIDVLCATLSGILSGLSIRSDGAWCDSLQTWLCLITCIYFALVAALRPQGSQIDFITGCSNAFLASLTSVLAVVGADSYSSAIVTSQALINFIAVVSVLIGLVADGYFHRLFAFLKGVFGFGPKSSLVRRDADDVVSNSRKMDFFGGAQSTHSPSSALAAIILMICDERRVVVGV